MGQIFLLFMILLIFYFVLIVPQRREQKRHQDMVAALKKGDEVVMTGGLVGEIVHITDDRLTLRTAESRVMVDRGRVARLATAPEPAAK